MSEAAPQPRATGHRTRADGGTQTWHEWGDPLGRPVLYCHGFPATGREAGFTDAPARARGVRVIAPDRPGFGASSPVAYGRIVDWAHEADDLLTALHLKRVPVVGVSGGLPYALAVAARRPRRVEAVAGLGGLGPIAEMGSSAGMSALGRASVYLAQHHPLGLKLLYTLLSRVIRIRPTTMFRILSALGRERDRELLRDPYLRAVWVAALRASVAQGAGPAVDEMGRYARPWGFHWSAVRAPVTLWHGTHDPVVPAEHARFLARRLPHARLELLSGEGHFSTAIGAIDAALDTLLPS